MGGKEEVENCEGKTAEGNKLKNEDMNDRMIDMQGKKDACRRKERDGKREREDDRMSDKNGGRLIVEDKKRKREMTE